MNVKYQIFVSSTYEDLRDERNEIIKACLNMGHIPVGMEMFNAADEEQWAVIQRTIDQCDYYAVIVAHRYGSTTPEGISFTEKEYDYAVAQGVPVLGFVIDESASWPTNRCDKKENALAALEAFKTKVKQKMIRPWRDRTELRAHFVESLSTTINLKPRRGWVRAPEAGGADIAQAFSNLTEENARLRRRLEELASSSVVDDEVNNVVQLLDTEILHDHGLTGSSIFLGTASKIEQGLESSTLIALLQEELGIHRKKGNEFLMKMRLWNLIERYDGKRHSFRITPLNRKVYKYFELKARAGS